MNKQNKQIKELLDDFYGESKSDIEKNEIVRFIQLAWDQLEFIIYEEDKKMKYKFVKDFRPVDLLNAPLNEPATTTHSTIEPTLKERDRFAKRCTSLGLSMFEPLKMEKWFVELIELEDCFERWLIRKGYIEKEEEFVFKPFDLTIRIKSSEQYWDLWHRTKASSQRFKGYIKNFEDYNESTPKISDNFGSRNDINKHKEKADPSKK